MMNQENDIEVFSALAQESRLTIFWLLVSKEPEGFAEKSRLMKFI